jgi:septal ring factor EnvC (AmiA/AmiB activator)
MKKFILLLTVSIFVSGCISMPGQVEDKYLVEKNENESALIKQIEQKIIDKNKEKQIVEKKLKEISNSPEQTETELKLLKKENGLLKDQVDFYTKTKDAVNLESRQAALKENEIAISKKNRSIQLPACGERDD